MDFPVNTSTGNSLLSRSPGNSGPKQSSHAGKIHLFGKVQVFGFPITTFYMHGSSISVFFNLFVLFVFVGDTSKIGGSLAWEFKSGELDHTFYVLDIRKHKNRYFQLPPVLVFLLSCLVVCWKPLGIFWRPFGAFVVSLACWCHPFVCLWLAWAVCGPSMLIFVAPLARLG